MNRFAALLRGINVGGNTIIPMAGLRALCADLGWEEVRTYIQSGNIVFASPAGASALETALEEAVEREFGRPVPVIVRSADEWGALAQANPFAEASRSEPNRVMLCLSKSVPAEGSAEALKERAKDGEAVALAEGALWIHYPAGAGTSKLSPSVLDRIVGSPVTARNWRTVLKLRDMLSE